MTKDTGGPAYPQQRYLNPESEGMTLLDYYGGNAMMGLIRGNTSLEGDTTTIINADQLSSMAYQIAAAMIAEKRRSEK